MVSADSAREREMVNVLTETCLLGRPLTASFVLSERTLAEAKWNSYTETNKTRIRKAERWV